MVSTAILEQKRVLNLTCWPSVVPVPVQVSSGCFGFPTQPKDLPIRLPGNSKLSIGVNASVNCCSSLC